MKDLRYALQNCDQLPEGLDWLTPGERARYEEFRFEKRQQDWLLGRWTAKQALLELAGLPRSEKGPVGLRTAAFKTRGPGTGVATAVPRQGPERRRPHSSEATGSDRRPVCAKSSTVFGRTPWRSRREASSEPNRNPRPGTSLM